MNEASAHRVVSLAFLTGLAGLGSETAFFKLFDLTLGSSPLVAFAVVAVFIAGMGIGAELSPRIRRPFIAEALVALYDLAWIALFDPLRALAGAVVSIAAPSIGVNAIAAIACVLFALPPAVLLGVSFPAIVEKRAHLAFPYAINALGAALGVVLVDAVLYPRLGLFACLGFLALVHAIAAFYLFGSDFRFERRPRAPLPLILIAVGAATGAFQGVWLFLAELLFQPFYFVQPAVVATMISGLAIGSLSWIRVRSSFSRTIFFALCGIALSSLLSVFVPRAETMAGAVAWIALLVAPAAIPIGALVPAFFGDGKVTRSEVGAGWLAIACGNALGVFLAGGVLLSLTTPLGALVVIGTVLLMVCVRREPWAAFALAVIAGSVLAVDDADYIARIPEHDRKTISVQHLFRGPAELSAVYTMLSPRTGSNLRRLYQTGFSPMYLDQSPEAVIGAVGASYARGTDRVLILGAGSGLSASAMASLFKECDVVDVGATVPALLKALAKENNGLLEKKNVRYHPIDGVLAPYALHERYDLIVLTVDPAFHQRAAKLYTREFFEQLRAMLNDGGVFIFWADADLDAEASQVLINTGRAVFPRQKLVSAFDQRPGENELSYWFLVHGTSDLIYRPERAGEVVALPRDESTRLIRGRAHDTEAIHSMTRPAPSVLFGGHHEGVVPMR